MKLINAGLDGDVKKAARRLEEGHMFYSPKNSVRLHYEPKWIYCGRSPYRAGHAPIRECIWDNVEEWQKEEEVTKLIKRTFKLKYLNKRLPIVGNIISHEQGGTLYPYIGQRDVERAYIWEEVGNG